MLPMVRDAEAAGAEAEIESAHRTDRMSARSQRIEVITRGERRRRWSVEQKREIAAESLEPNISPITVARRYGISSGLLYTWRRHLLEGSLGVTREPAAQFARVEVMAMPTDPAIPPAVQSAARDGTRGKNGGAPRQSTAIAVHCPHTCHATRSSSTSRARNAPAVAVRCM